MMIYYFSFWKHCLRKILPSRLARKLVLENDKMENEKENKMENSRKLLRSHYEIFLVGPAKQDFFPTKIPSKKNVLQVFFYLNKIEGFSIWESMQRAADKITCLELENIKRKDHIKKEIKKLYEIWRGDIFEY